MSDQPRAEENVDDFDVADSGYQLRTCDQCGEQKLCEVTLLDGFYICLDCEGFHQRALTAATAAVEEAYALFRDPRYGTELVTEEVREIVALAVKAYCEFTDE